MNAGRNFRHAQDIIASAVRVGNVVPPPVERRKTHRGSRTKAFLLALSAGLGLLALAGCGAGAAPESSDDASGEVTFGPGTFDLTDPAVGLAELPGYGATLAVSFDGTRGGQPERWTRSYTLAAAQEPAIRVLSIETDGQPGGQASPPVMWAEAGGMLYEVRDDDTCVASASEEGSGPSSWEPAALLSPVLGADEAGSEAVNGVPADHYTFDERAYGLANVVKTAGEVWVAPDGGYVLQYTASTEGGPEYFGEGIEGTLTWSYNLALTGGPLDAELPANCPAALADLPVMADAKDLRVEPGVTSYVTASSIADVLAFYLEQLPAAGWQAGLEPLVDETVGTADFLQGDRQLQVMASAGEQGTYVQLMAGEAFIPEDTIEGLEEEGLASDGAPVDLEALAAESGVDLEALMSQYGIDPQSLMPGTDSGE